jgi:hypothetical protein
VHIKETFATIMADILTEDHIEYTGLIEKDKHLYLYPCLRNAAKFNELLNRKLSRAKKTSHDTDKTKKKLRAYLKTRASKIAETFRLTVVTDFEKDHLLTVKDEKAGCIYVYFGAMNVDMIFAACWLRIQIVDKEYAESPLPKFFFWVLNMSYAQELEVLGDLNGVVISNLDKVLDFSQGIEYSSSV